VPRALFILASVCLLAPPPQSATPPVRGGAASPPGQRTPPRAGGSTFVLPVMDLWTKAHAQARGTAVEYQPIGSGAGIQKLIAGELDLCCTDAPLDGEQLEKAIARGGPVLHVPLVVSAVVPIYRLDGIAQPLNFTGAVLADVYLGQLTKWNDPRLTELNPGVALPDQRIVAFHRSDGSGTTFILSDFLYRTSAAWRERMGRGTALAWPKTLRAAEGGDGMLASVQACAGALGYVEVNSAQQAGLMFGNVRNRKGEFLAADAESIAAAAANSLNEIPKDYRYSLAGAPGIGSYPLCGTTFAVVYARAAAVNPELRGFLHWLVSAEGGQKLAPELGFAPLPRRLAARLARELAVPPTPPDRAPDAGR
jgi:phosphate ABC transporter phosphate-binding protein